MIDPIDIFLPIVPPPTTSQMKRAARTKQGIRFFKSKEQQDSEHSWASVLLPHQPPTPLDGPLEVSIALFYPYTKGDTQRVRDRDRKDHIPHTSKPDLDNVVKALTDQLVRLKFIVDDSRIYDLRVRKFRAPMEDVGVSIRISFDPFFDSTS